MYVPARAPSTSETGTATWSSGPRAATRSACRRSCRGTASSYEFTAIEDSLVLAVPAAVFLGLYEAEPAVKDFFDHEHLGGRVRQAAAATEVTDRGAAGLRTSAQSLVHRAPETTSSSVTIREAAETMRRRGVSSLLLVDGGRLVGIVTDRDLRNQALAEERDAAEPVATITTPGPVTGPWTPSRSSC